MLKKMLTTATVALAASVSAAAAADLTQMSWDEIVAQAKEEGEVTWYVWYLRDELSGAISTFEEEYGIKVTIPEGTSGANQEKLLAEKDRETGDIDVMAFGVDTVKKWDLEGLFSPLTVLLPDMEGRKQEILGVNGDGFALPYWGNQTGIAYDPEFVPEDSLPQDAASLAAFMEANPGRFGFNADKGWAGRSWVISIYRDLSDADFADGSLGDERVASLTAGTEWLQSHGEQYVVTTSNADSITRISDRELWMAPAYEDHLAGMQNRGEARKEIRFYIPEMGMAGGGNMVSIPKNAPHPAAAVVFANWLTSAETQTMFNRDFGTAPMHEMADDSMALVPNDQRDRQIGWAHGDFLNVMMDQFTEEVLLNR
ncbi:MULTISPECIES: extracellular solute-binding protein [unclassified Phaeobacter]|uniref:extracellular solute-binding protein n=1 Tax=unclassified Phaeobacter TaxID=2621772 RepID=UPI003A872B1E